MILGVCGNIASGKSTFLRVAEEQGWLVINSDKIVHELYSPGKEGQRRVSDFFGEEYIQKNGHVNRKKLGKIVFGDIKKLKILNALIHPLVINEIQKIIDKNKGRNTAVESVYFEDKYLNKVVDKIVLIERPKAKIKIELANRGVDEKLFDNIFNSIRLPAKADVKIHNNSSLNSFEKKVIILLEKFK